MPMIEVSEAELADRRAIAWIRHLKTGTPMPDLPYTDPVRVNDLIAVNEDLWDAEDRIREAIADRNVPLIASLATRIVELNDERARLKRETKTYARSP